MHRPTVTDLLILILFVLLGVLICTPAHAEGFDWKPYTAMGVGQGLDVWSKRHDINLGGCWERNTTTYGSRYPTTRRLVERKLEILIPVAIAMRILEATGHDRVSHWLGYGAGATGGATTAWNLHLDCTR